MNIAVILAGGTGTRMGGNEPKQFLSLGGRAVVEHSVSLFDSHPAIDEIAVVVHPDYLERMQQTVKRNHWHKVTRLLCGGAERYLSSLSAIEAYAPHPDANLLFHDAARPLVNGNMVSRVVDALAECNAVTVAIDSADTIAVADETGQHLSAIPDRRTLRRVQTPQAFKQHTIAEAYALALRDPHFAATDDCGTVLRYLPDEPIRLVEGSARNIKITYPEDLLTAEQLLKVQ